MAEQHHHDPVAHHTEKAASATGLKKKLGPLPVWAWVAIVGGAVLVYYFMHSSSSSSGTPTADTVDPNNPLGLTYAQEQQDMEEGIDPNSGESYASEQSAADSTDTGTGATDSSADDSTELTAIDSDLQTLQSEYASGLDDGATPEQTFAGEIGDVTAGITALQALQGTLSPTPPTASGTTSSAASTAALVKTINKADTNKANSAAAAIEAEQAAVAKTQAAASTAAAKAAAASPKKAAGGGLIGTVKVSGKKK